MSSSSPYPDHELGFPAVFADNMFVLEWIEQERQEKANICSHKQHNRNYPHDEWVFLNHQAPCHLVTISALTDCGQVVLIFEVPVMFVTIHHVGKVVLRLLLRLNRWDVWRDRGVTSSWEKGFSVILLLLSVELGVHISTWSLLCLLGELLVRGTWPIIRIRIRHLNYYTFYINHSEFNINWILI